jgi:hypothetical protein
MIKLLYDNELVDPEKPENVKILYNWCKNFYNALSLFLRKKCAPHLKNPIECRKNRNAPDSHLAPITRNSLNTLNTRIAPGNLIARNRGHSPPRSPLVFLSRRDVCCRSPSGTSAARSPPQPI